MHVESDPLHDAQLLLHFVHVPSGFCKYSEAHLRQFVPGPSHWPHDSWHERHAALALFK